MFPRKVKGIAKCLDIYGFWIVEYSVRSESRCMIVIWDHEYYVPGLPKYLRIISPQGISTSELYKGTFIANFHDEHDSYAVINLSNILSGVKVDV